MDNISKLETDLWDAADNLRANSKLTSSEYCMPVLGVIFLRHATNRYDAVVRQIEADTADKLGRILLLGFNQRESTTNRLLSKTTREEMRTQATAQSRLD